MTEPRIPTTVTAPFGSDGLSFFEYRLDNDAVCAAHSHGDWELVFVLEGSIGDVRSGRAVQVTSPSLLSLPAGETHAPHAKAGAKWFEIRIQSSWLEQRQGCLQFFEEACAVSQGVPIWLAYKLLNEFRSRDNLSGLMMEGLLLEMLVDLSRRTSVREGSRSPIWLRRARDFLHDGFRENLTLTAVADAARVHPSHLARGFRQHLGCTPGAYVRRLRAQYAEHLLGTTDAPLAAIALEAGFSHQSHFCRVFKEQTGLTPAEFKRSRNRDASIGQSVRV